MKELGSKGLALCLAWSKSSVSIRFYYFVVVPQFPSIVNEAACHFLLSTSGSCLKVWSWRAVQSTFSSPFPQARRHDHLPGLEGVHRGLTHHQELGRGNNTSCSVKFIPSPWPHQHYPIAQMRNLRLTGSFNPQTHPEHLLCAGCAGPSPTGLTA